MAQSHKEKHPKGYLPGVCNIGPKEVSAKKALTAAGFFISVAVVVYAPQFHLPLLWHVLILFVPITFTVLEMVQIYFQFCINYGFQGVSNMVHGMGKTDKVPTLEFCVQDKSRASMLTILSLLISIALTSLTLLI